jgi:hypothetical protein
MKKVFIIVLLVMASLKAWSQTDRLDSLLIDVLGNDKQIMRLIDPPAAYFYIYGGLNGDSKTFYAGRELGDNMISANGSMYLFHSKGFFAGVSGMWQSQTVPGYSATIATVGTSLSLNKKKSLRFRTAYSRYFYNYVDSVETGAFNNNINAGLSLRNRWIGARLSMNALFGEDFGINVTPEIFSYITVARFGKYNKIQLAPELSAFIGSETVELKKSGSQTDMQTKDVYSLLNTQFYLPVCLYLGDFDIELGYSVNIPVTQDDNTDYPVTSFFSFSLGYLIPLN